MECKIPMLFIGVRFVACSNRLQKKVVFEHICTLLIICALNPFV
jgi:hypothetical protein